MQTSESKREANARRQQDFRDRKHAAGLKQVRNLWCHPEDEEQVKKYAARLVKGRNKREKQGLSPSRG